MHFRHDNGPNETRPFARNPLTRTKPGGREGTRGHVQSTGSEGQGGCHDERLEAVSCPRSLDAAPRASLCITPIVGKDPKKQLVHMLGPDNDDKLRGGSGTLSRQNSKAWGYRIGHQLL